MVTLHAQNMHYESASLFVSQSNFLAAIDFCYASKYVVVAMKLYMMLCTVKLVHSSHS